MNLIVSPLNYQNALELCSKKFNGIVLVGVKQFTNKSSCLLSLQQLVKLNLITKKHNKELYVLIDAFIYEEDLNALIKLLKFIEKNNIPGVVFNDFAIAQIHYENKFKFKLIYDSKSLVTNYGQLDFYKSNHISKVFLPDELRSFEISEFSKNKKIELIKQVAGYVYIMQSRWQTVKTFCLENKIKTNLHNKKLFLKEDTRDFYLILIENDFGTNIYTGYSLSLIDQLDLLKKSNIDYIFIDGYLHDSKWLIKQ